MNNKSLALSSFPAIASSKVRILALDTQRGLIMCLMALSHCQEYVALPHYRSVSWHKEAAWEGTTVYELAHQALISLVASGGFFMMMGLGITLLFEARLKEGWSLHKICRYLIMRGSFLIFIQFSVLQLFEFMAEKKFYIYVGALFGLGMCMIFAALLLYCSHRLKKLPYASYILPLIFFILIPSLNHLIMDNIRLSGNELSWAHIAFLVGGNHMLGEMEISINFSPFPWFPAAAWGLILGRIILDHKQRAFYIITQLSLIFIISCIIIRFTNIYGHNNIGDYRVFAENTRASLATFFIITKYPPSICYFLWSLGLNMLFLSLWNSVINVLGLFKLSEIFRVFGRSALLFFISHWFVYYGLSRLLPSRELNLPGQLTIWIAGLIILYYACQAFYPFKMKQDKDSFWRML